MVRGVSSWRRLLVAVVMSVSLVGLALPAVASAKRPPLGKYTCFYPPFSTPHPLKLVSKTKYTVDKSKKSRYKFKKGKLVFSKGAYSDYYGRYEAAERRIVIYDKETDARFWNCDKAGK